MGSLKRLCTYASPFRADIVLAVIYSILNKAFDILPELLIGVAVDVVVNQKQSIVAQLGITDTLQQLTALGLLTLLVFCCESVLQYLYQVKWRTLAQALQHCMRMEVYQHLQKLEMAYFDEKSTGNLLSIVNDDINQLERFLDGGANALIQVVASTLLIGSIFFYISPSIAMIALMPMPLILFGAYRFQKLLGPRYALVREIAGRISGRLSNNILGMGTIQSFGAHDFECERLASDSTAYQEANRRAIKLSSAFIPIIRMAIVAGFVATLILGGYYTVRGELQVASYSVLVFLTQRLLWPFTRIAEMSDLFERAMASADRVLDLLHTPVQIVNGHRSLTKVAGEIRFQNVSFSYENGSGVLQNFNLTIQPGTTIGIVGITGAGKTTIIRLLMRYYAVTKGKILIDGIDISEIKLRDLRSLISLVSQDTFLFPGSIRDNIAYPNVCCSLEDIKNAAEIAGIHQFISSLPAGYETQVGERGIKLSGGQKQRLSIARSVLKNAPIFILDEATSSLDMETEEAIQKSFSKIAHNRTTIIIAHRLSTVRHADRIYVLDNGNISEADDHDALCKSGGMYARLWHIQTGSEVA